MLPNSYRIWTLWLRARRPDRFRSSICNRLPRFLSSSKRRRQVVHRPTKRRRCRDDRSPPTAARTCYFYRSLGNIRQRCSLTLSRIGTAYIPLPIYQALILIVHDQFQDSDYWTGNIDLRHLIDLCELASSAEGLDWNLLSAMSASKLYRNALETQLVTLHSLFDVDVPRELRTRLTPRLQFRRRLIQSRIPLLRFALLATALLDYLSSRAEVGARKEVKHFQAAAVSLPKIHNLRHLFDLSAEKRPGKV